MEEEEEEEGEGGFPVVLFRFGEEEVSFWLGGQGRERAPMRSKKKKNTGVSLSLLLQPRRTDHGQRKPKQPPGHAVGPRV